jgi:hypothetical protein
LSIDFAESSKNVGEEIHFTAKLLSLNVPENGIGIESKGSLEGCLAPLRRQ